MNHTRLITSVALAAFGSSVSLANNTFFLPGDAYFYVRLDLKGARQLDDVESPVLHYSSHWDAGVGCGFIGYEKIQRSEVGWALPTENVMER